MKPTILLSEAQIKQGVETCFRNAVPPACRLGGRFYSRLRKNGVGCVQQRARLKRVE
ncbi:MAG: hypothetical protein WCA59_06040 [Candidatus Binataceae bacterium]